MHRLTALMLVAALGVGCAPGPGAASGVETAALDVSLKPFYAALDALQAHRRNRVAVLQIGDSHTANDAFSGRLRDLMQARFGDGGRGLLPPGIPYDYYRPAQIRVTAEGWTTLHSSVDSSGAFGLAGVQQRGRAGARMSLEAEPGGLAWLEIDALGQPGGGTLELTSGSAKLARLSTSANRPGLLRLQAAPGNDAAAVQIQVLGDGPVTLLSWRAERAQRGITWSNLGTIGATVDLLQHWDPALMRAEMAHLAPDLIILAFGTNEGFRDTTDLALYPGQFAAALTLLRQIAPSAAILVAGPPGGVRSVLPPGVCGNSARPGPPSSWAIPPNLPRIRAIERATAAREGLFFWDWAASMGGDCAIVPWAETDPPLAARDHVHLLKPGYMQTAETLFTTLMDGYDQYRRRH